MNARLLGVLLVRYTVTFGVLVALAGAAAVRVVPFGVQLMGLVFLVAGAMMAVVALADGSGIGAAEAVTEPPTGATIDSNGGDGPSERNVDLTGFFIGLGIAVSGVVFLVLAG